MNRLHSRSALGADGGWRDHEPPQADAEALGPGENGRSARHAGLNHE